MFFITKIIFWSSLLLLIHTFLGYPLLIFILGKLRDEKNFTPPVTPPAVTVILAAHNEAARLAPRLENLLASEYPPDRLHVIIVDDGSTDSTAAEIALLQTARVKLIRQRERQGKAAALNLAAAAAESELIVFADVRQRFAPDTIAKLARHFGDLETGAVSGELLIESAASTVGGGVDAYWRLEKFIRLAESRWDSSIGCTGAVYAIRRELYREIPADTILDDVVIPMQIAEQGFRVGFDPEARAFDPQTLEPEREQIRKRRTLAGNYQMLFRQPRWLSPRRCRLWWQLISHKYLRLAAPFLLGALFFSNLLLARRHPILLLGQITFYTLAIVGARTGKKSPWFTLPAGFTFLNLMALDAARHYFFGQRHSRWQKAG